MRPAWVLVFLAIGGCQSSRVTPYTPSEEVERNTVLAERLTRRAAELMESEPERAEALLREALANDIFFGPAHNNLGVLHLERDELYEAASEFEWARKLMPGHPDPRLNLAITLERAGREDEALVAYTAALEVYPGYVPAIQGLAKLFLSTGRDDPRLEEWLDRLAVEGESQAWRDWARERRARDD